MRETIEFRIAEHRAASVLAPADGDRIGKGAVRRIVLPLDDPRVALIGDLERQLRREQRAFFTYWRISREYSPQELAAAPLLRITFSVRFEPAGEECGTRYDYTEVCPVCAAGRRQITPLALDLGKVKRNLDCAETIAGDEWVVSEATRRAVADDFLTGLVLTDVLEPRSASPYHPRWYQLAISSAPVEVAPMTQFGVNPFIEGTDARYRCPLGHVLGLNILSELSVARESWDGSDFVQTRQLIGMREGLLVPRPMLLVTQRAWRQLRERRLRGFEVEVAHLV